MLCRKPYREGVAEYGCGQCTPCRLNRRRLWASRIMLESRVHEFNSFWTFTYDESHLPSDGSLRPRDVQLFLKRLRIYLGDRVCRYYFVGEYGDISQRPHYHAALFGVSEVEAQRVAQIWALGYVAAGSLTWQSASYIAGYVTKKLTKKDDPALAGRYPEFARMSLRPGIGAVAVPGLAAELSTDVGSRLVVRDGDVPTSVQAGKAHWPLGRYLRRRLREECGFETVGGQALPAIRRAQELQALCDVEGGTAQGLEARRLKDEVRMTQMEGRARIYRKQVTL